MADELKKLLKPQTAKADNVSVQLQQRTSSLQKYRGEQAERDRKLNLAKKGQSDTSNFFNDLGTTMIKNVTQFQMPSNEELEKGRSGWSGRGELIRDGITHGLANELTGGAMSAIASGAAKAGAKKLIAKTTDAIQNTHKINPLAFKVNPDNFYRTVGKAGYKDAIESGVVRANPNGAGIAGSKLSRPSDVSYFAKGEIANYPGKEVVAETSKPLYMKGDINPVTQTPIRSRHWGYRNIDEMGNSANIPTNDVRFLKKDWLMGYKEIKPNSGLSTTNGLSMDGIKETVKSIPSKVNNYVQTKVVEPTMQLGYNVKYRNDIKEYKATGNRLFDELKEPESMKRLENLGIDTEAFFKTRPKFTSKRNTNTNYDSQVDAVNYNFNHMSAYGDRFNVPAVVDHELGHRMQAYSHHAWRTTDGTRVSTPLMTDQVPLDKMLEYKPIYNLEEQATKQYFLHGSENSTSPTIERTPHLIEKKRNMINEGILKSRTDVVTPKKLGEFYKTGTKDRIASIIDKDDPDNYTKLSSLMNYLPAAGPTVLAASALLNKNKK